MAHGVHITTFRLSKSSLERATADARRSRVLERLGYRVLRVEAELVRVNLAHVVEQVRNAVRVRNCTCVHCTAFHFFWESFDSARARQGTSAKGAKRASARYALFARLRESFNNFPCCQ